MVDDEKTCRDPAERLELAGEVAKNRDEFAREKKYSMILELYTALQLNI